MLFIMLIVTGGLLFIGLLWYALHIPILQVVNTMFAISPDAYDPAVVDFTVQFTLNFLVIVLIAATVYVYVQSQKKEVYYG